MLHRDLMEETEDLCHVPVPVNVFCGIFHLQEQAKSFKLDSKWVVFVCTRWCLFVPVRPAFWLIKLSMPWWDEKKMNSGANIWVEETHWSLVTGG